MLQLPRDSRSGLVIVFLLESVTNVTDGFSICIMLSFLSVVRADSIALIRLCISALRFSVSFSCCFISWFSAVIISMVSMCSFSF